VIDIQEPNMPRVAFVHDWLTGMRGGEKCLERFVSLFPDCEIFTLFHRAGSISPIIASRPIHASWLQQLPGWSRYYRYLLPFFPSAAHWKLDGFDLVVSLSHCVAKAAVAPAGVPHVCYCFTPMRYAWHMREQYFGTGDSLKERMRARVLTRLRDWDRRTAERVTHFIAISRTVQQRIRDVKSLGRGFLARVRPRGGGPGRRELTVLYHAIGSTADGREHWGVKG
jgi:hypothetical protein